MAQLILKGSMATIEFTSDPEDGQAIATCIEHSEADARLAPPGNCDWTERYDTLDDATEYAADHADRGTR
jgi:hypothetical protein